MVGVVAFVGVDGVVVSLAKFISFSDVGDVVAFEFVIAEIDNDGGVIANDSAVGDVISVVADVGCVARIVGDVIAVPELGVIDT